MVNRQLNAQEGNMREKISRNIEIFGEELSYSKQSHSTGIVNKTKDKHVPVLQIAMPIPKPKVCRAKHKRRSVSTEWPHYPCSPPLCRSL
jgi:hypothetical protein